eukprot:3707544-Pyramimonas_sp.AAC.1
MEAQLFGDSELRREHKEVVEDGARFHNSAVKTRSANQSHEGTSDISAARTDQKAHLLVERLAEVHQVRLARLGEAAHELAHQAKQQDQVREGRGNIPTVRTYHLKGEGECSCGSSRAPSRTTTHFARATQHDQRVRRPQVS